MDFRKLLPITPVAYVFGTSQSHTQLAATYSRTGTTVTVTSNNHGHRVGHYIRFDATSGTATDGIFVVTSVTTNTFTFTHGTSGSTSGNCTLWYRNNYKRVNVHSVVPEGNGNSSNAYVNLDQTLSDTSYMTLCIPAGNAGSSGSTDDSNAGVRMCTEIDSTASRTTTAFKISGGAAAGLSSDYNHSVMVFV